jgi:hypothetical protein
MSTQVVSDRVSKITMPDGRSYAFGRNRPVTKPRFHLHNYIDRALPAPPTSTSYSAKNTSLSKIYLNDSEGDCVIAMGYHALGNVTGNAGTCFVATDDQINKDYGAIGGYIPGDPGTDNGCDEQTANTYWTNMGFQDGSKLLGWLGVDATSQTLLQTGIWLFECLFFGLELPDAWVNPMPQQSGFTWDVAGKPNPGYGHGIAGVDYSPAGILVATWAMTGNTTYPAVAKYMVSSAGGEAYIPVFSSLIAKGQTKAPNGFDWAGLISDFNSLGGNLPVPSPTPPVPIPPTPTPTPVPPGPVPAGAYTISGTFTGSITPSS